MVYLVSHFFELLSILLSMDFNCIFILDLLWVCGNGYIFLQVSLHLVVSSQGGLVDPTQFLGPLVKEKDNHSLLVLSISVVLDTQFHLGS